MKNKRIKLALVLGLLLFACGCAVSPDYRRGLVLPARLAEVSSVAGRSVQHRKIDYIKIGSGGRAVMYIASIHGDETAGTPLLLKLAEYLQSPKTSLGDTTVVIIPLANPDGAAAVQRNNANGVDLNRNFPADNRQDNSQNGYNALTEPESQALYELIQRYNPQIIVSIHQPAKGKDGWVDYDGNGQGIAEKMSALSGLAIYKYGAMPGSLGSFVGESLGAAVITLELPHENLTANQLWEKYGRMLLAVIEF